MEAHRQTVCRAALQLPARALDQCAHAGSRAGAERSALRGHPVSGAARTEPFQQAGLFGGLSVSDLFPQGVRWPAGAALASLLMGLVGGYAYASTGIGYDQADSAYYAAFGIDSAIDWVSLE